MRALMVWGGCGVRMRTGESRQWPRRPNDCGSEPDGDGRLLRRVKNGAGVRLRDRESGGGGSAGTRTLNQLIKSQLLYH
jgi:hypothetical protein